MSNAAEEVDDRAGASCGVGEVDGVKSEECSEHDEEFDSADELHDRKLFTQPDETHEGECPLCCLPLPIDPTKSLFYTCCSQTICMGCVYANFTNNLHDRVKAQSCPFCREPAKDDENDKRLMKRVKANDPAALRYKGVKCYNEGDYDTAFEYLTKAAELGNVDAHAKLGCMYWEGEGVEKDEKKAVYHYEKAAIGGHPDARHDLACIEEKNGNIERAVKHHMIAAKLGHVDAMRDLWKHYSAENITKEDLDATLRTHQAAINAMKSAQRDSAEVVWKNY
jgi:tetratricopeptide (TPR) repeat protein